MTLRYFTNKISINSLSINQIKQYKTDPEKLILELKQDFIKRTVTKALILLVIIPSFIAISPPILFL